MKQVLIRRGAAGVYETPVPGLEAGSLLVRVDHSCVSAGTEMAALRNSGEPLWKRALKQPHYLQRALALAAKQGVSAVVRAVENRQSAGHATGYSLAGVVEAVGEGVDDLHPGDRVACAGAQCAHHAEYVTVPRRLACRIPDGVGFDEASTVALGAIALQGVRRAEPTLGESFVVIGLGVLGQLTAQLLKANGCRVVGIDVDRARLELAKESGIAAVLHPEDADQTTFVSQFTQGVLADGVIITAAASSSEIVASAFAMCRRKGRVVLVGDVGLNLNRADFYAKEIDFRISASYGPGRYDPRYEEQGQDYPIAYVRWTEGRNMEQYLRLIADKQLNVKPLIAATYSIDDAAEAYAALAKGVGPSPIVLLRYPNPQPYATQAKVILSHSNRSVPRPVGERIGLAVIGAGSFARDVHLPNLQSLEKYYSLRAIVGRQGHVCRETAARYGAAYATTDVSQVWNDEQIDAVLIATRHHLHGSQVLAALRAGKHVLVEKPLSLTAVELDEIEEFYEAYSGPSAPPLLMTAFNRRFAPLLQPIQKAASQRRHPLLINYRMNAGYLPLDHWVHGPEGGGRNLGEACHLYDLFTHLVNDQAHDVQVQAVRPGGRYSHRDNFVATLKFADGSVASLTYTSLGNTSYPKEQLEMFCDGAVYALDDYRRLRITAKRDRVQEIKVFDKGHRGELEAFAAAIREGGTWPIPLWQQLQGSRIALAVESQLQAAMPRLPEALRAEKPCAE